MSEAWQRLGKVEERWLVISAGVSEAGRRLLEPMPDLRRVSEVGSMQDIIGREKKLPAISRDVTAVPNSILIG